MKDKTGDVRERLSFLQFAGIYLGAVVGFAVVSVLTERITGFGSERVALFYIAVLFGFAAWGRPWWWSAAIRSAGWFAIVPNRILTWLLIVFAAFALWSALSA